MTKEELTSELKTFQEQYYKKVETYFLEEIKKISDKYDVWITNYTILKLYNKTTNEQMDEDKFEHWDKVQDELWTLTIDRLGELEYRHAAYEYSPDAKFLH